jgi:hypothetical protein
MTSYKLFIIISSIIYSKFVHSNIDSIKISSIGLSQNKSVYTGVPCSNGTFNITSKNTNYFLRFFQGDLQNASFSYCVIPEIPCDLVLTSNKIYNGNDHNIEKWYIGNNINTYKF